MKTIESTRRIAILCAVPILLWPSIVSAKAKRDVNKQLQSAIAKVRKAKTADAKYDTAERLEALTDNRDCSDVSDETVRSMISLLDVPDDGVRLWVAAALGDIGPRAKIAAPKLLSILAEVECKHLDFSSEATIPIALRRMGVTPPPKPSYNDCHKS